MLMSSEWVDTPDDYPQNILICCHVNLVDSHWDQSPQRWDHYPPHWTNPYAPHIDEYPTVYGLPCEVVEQSDDNTTHTSLLYIEWLWFQKSQPENLKKLEPECLGRLSFLWTVPTIVNCIF